MTDSSSRMFPPNGGRRIIAGIWFNLFSTIALLAVLGPGVRSWQALGTVALVGLAADGMRHRLSPECRISPAVMWRHVEEGFGDTPAYKRSLLIWKALLNATAVLWIFYYVLFAAFVRPDESFEIPSYFGFFAPIERLFSAVSSLDRRAVADLIAHGYPHRAHVVSFFYASNACLFVLFGVVFFSGYSYIKPFDTISAMRKRDSSFGSPTRTLWTSLGLFVFGVLSHLFIHGLFGVRTSGHAPFVWDLSSSNEGIKAAGLGEAACACSIFWSYQCIVVARVLEHRSKCFRW